MFSTRKIISGLVLLLVGLIVTYIKGDIPPNLLSLMQLLYSAFIIGNSLEHATTTYSEAKKNNKV